MRRTVSVAIACLAAAVGAASAAETLETGWVAAQGNKARARLSAGRQDGKDYALIEIELAPGWKTYWRNPGEAGLPPEFGWDGSENLARTAPFYPAPHRFLDKAGETIGYKDRVIFPVEIGREDAGKPTTIAAAVQYGVCKEICIPAEAQLTLSLPPGDLPELGGDVLADVPRGQGSLKSGDPVIARAVVLFDGAGHRIEIETQLGSGAAKEAEAFLYAEGGLYVPSPEFAKDLGDGRALFVAKFEGGVDVEALKGRAITATVRTASGASTAPVARSP